MRFLKSDGTVISSDVPKEVVESVPDLNLASAQIGDWLDETGVCWALFGETDQALVKIRRRNLRQAITAATDFIRYGRYDHEYTTEGLHILSDTDFSELHNEDIGVIRSSYAGSLIQPPQKEGDQHVWHQLGIRLGNVYTMPIPQSYRETRSTKHDFIEYLVLGYALQVWVAPVRDYLAPFAVQWLLEDDVAARNFKTERLTASRVRNDVIRPAGYKGWKATEAAKDVGENVVLPETLYVEDLEGGTINLMELDEPTDLKLYLGDVFLQTKTWEPGNDARIITIQEILEADEGIRAEIA